MRPSSPLVHISSGCAVLAKTVPIFEDSEHFCPPHHRFEQNFLKDEFQTSLMR
jgi:hypothetical protein